MVLESTMICVDNSNFMRNGDFVPTRLLAQQDAVNLVCHSKTRSNPENNIGLLSLGNKVEVLATLTTDVGRVLSKLHKVECNGDINFLTGIRIAHLALKHRQGKNHKMRLVVFVGSPIAMDQQEIVQLGKRLKKEKVNVDVVSFGEDEANRDLLTAFINAINGKDGTSSHLVTVAANQAGPLLSDALVTSPIIQGEDGAGSSNVNFEFGVDPNDDPELALALRVSMEEQRHLQQDADSRRAGTVAVTPSEPAIPEMASEEALLERALAMSMEDHDTGSLQLAPGNEDLPDFAAMTEEEQIAFAMRMSAMETASESSGTASVQVTKDPKEEKEKKEDKKPKKEDEKMEVEEDEDDKPS